MKTIKDLDNKCLAKIFSHLPIVDRIHVSHVCKKWKRLTWSIEWDHVRNFSTLSFTYKHLGQDFHTKNDIEIVLKHCGRFLRHLTLDSNFNSRLMPIVSKYCINLLTIYINFNRYYEEDFIGAFEKMKKLKSVKIVYWAQPIDNDTDILASLPANNIEEISFGVYPFINSPLSKVFAKELSRFESLRSLSLARSHLANEMLKVIVQLKNLVHLNLAGAHWDDEVMPVISNLSKLELVDLSSSPIDDDEVIDIAKKCKKLKCLNLYNCDNVTEQVIIRIRKLKDLTVISHFEKQ